MARKYDISFSRKQLVLISWLCSSYLDFLLSFQNFDDIDISELKDLSEYINLCVSHNFKL